MKNAKNAHFWQIDHEIKRIARSDHSEILPSGKAWEKYTWCRKHFVKKPKEGYFVWVKKQPNKPLSTCINISKNAKQKLNNLLIIEKDLDVELQGFCGNISECFKGSHQASGNIILKKGSGLKYRHIHSWGKDNIVEPNYEFLLEENAKLDYVYKTTHTPKKLTVKNIVTCMKGAKASIKIIADCQNTKFHTEDTIILKGEGSSGISRLRLIARQKSNIKAYSRILAHSPSSGHLDCQSLITDKNSTVNLIPEVVCESKDAQVTHEASVGKISEEQLNYLRTRGLNEGQAINLITAGFLKI